MTLFAEMFTYHANCACNSTTNRWSWTAELCRVGSLLFFFFSFVSQPFIISPKHLLETESIWLCYNQINLWWQSYERAWKNKRSHRSLCATLCCISWGARSAMCQPLVQNAGNRWLADKVPKVRMRILYLDPVPSTVCYWLAKTLIIMLLAPCCLAVSSDGLHLTPQGNGVVFEQVSRVFREAWLTPEEMPFDFPHHSQIDAQNPSKAFQDRCL